MVDTNELLKRGVAEIIDRNHLRERLKRGEKLRVKFGIDPTTPDLHLGHTVALRKLRQFQDAGHVAVLIIGDFTAMIGDPSGRDKTRPSLTRAQVKENAKAYEEQAFKILDQSKTEVRWQSEWFDKFGLDKVIELTAKVSTWHLLSHETFAQRKQVGQSLMHHETLYPLLQGYDSVAVKADLELGGIDQKFNLLTGRVVQQAYGQEPQDILLLPYLVGTDGKQKMSKTFGNTINLTDSAKEVYGKVMSLPDALVMSYFELISDLEFRALQKVVEELKNHPRDAKAHLAFLMVEKLYDEQSAQKEKDEFDRIFRSGEKPSQMQVEKFGQEQANIVDVLIKTKLAPSRSQAIRLIEQGGVKVDGVKADDPKKQIVINNTVIQVGKRRFAKLVR